MAGNEDNELIWKIYFNDEKREKSLSWELMKSLLLQNKNAKEM